MHIRYTLKVVVVDFDCLPEEVFVKLVDVALGGLNSTCDIINETLEVLSKETILGSEDEED